MRKSIQADSSSKSDSKSVPSLIARKFFRSGTDPDSIERDVRKWLLAIPAVVVVLPLTFYLQFGEVGPLGWGLTVFFVAYCLLAAVGLHFLERPQYHSPVKLKSDWLDRIGAFWLMSCAFGPLLGWALTSAIVLTPNNWRWLYWSRLGLCFALPVLTSLALVRYVRGRGAFVMLGILIGVTALPVWSGWNTLEDLRSGPLEFSGHQVLPHTKRALN